MFTTAYSYLCMVITVYSFLLPTFTTVNWFAFVCSCLTMFNSVYSPGLPMFANVYSFLSMFTLVYKYGSGYLSGHGSRRTLAICPGGSRDADNF